MPLNLSWKMMRGVPGGLFITHPVSSGSLGDEPEGAGQPAVVAALPLGPSTQVAGAGCPGRGRGQLGGERPSQGSGSLLAALPAVDKQVALASTAPGMVASTRRPWLEGGRRCADEPPPA